MKKTLLAIALMSASGIALATHDHGSSAASVYANSQTATYASAGNGGTSRSVAGNFAGGTGSTYDSTRLGVLSVTDVNCRVPTTATVVGHVTTVGGSVNTIGGSFASNVSTGNGTGTAAAAGGAQAAVSAEKNGVSGAASAVTETWANAGKNQTRSSFAEQGASFEAKGATGAMVVTQPETVRLGRFTFTVDKPIFVGVGAASTGTSDVSAATQLYSLGQGEGRCGHGGNCSSGPGNDDAGSYTNAAASTLTNVTYGNQPN